MSGDGILRPSAIVYVTSVPPWPTRSGGQIRTVANLDALSRLAAVHLMVFPFDPIRGDFDTSGVRLASTSVHPLVRPGPAGVIRDRFRAMAHLSHPYLVRWARAGGSDLLAERVAETGAGIVVLEAPFYPYAAEALHSPRPFIVADAADDRIAASTGLIRFGPGLKIRIRAILNYPFDVLSERRLGAVDQVWFVRTSDARRATVRHPGLDARVVPNVVDESRLAEIAAASQPPARRSAAFLGAYDYAPNEVAGLRFARGIGPALRRAAPDAILSLIGRNPTKSIRRAALAAGVELLGDVPDAAVTLRRFAVLVAPLASGAGSKVKILEALALRVPVVTTPIGTAGLDLEDGVHVLLGRTDTELAAATVRLWDDPVLAGSLAAAGAARVRERYSLEAHARQVADALAIAVADVPHAIATASGQ